MCVFVIIIIIISYNLVFLMLINLWQYPGNFPEKFFPEIYHNPIWLDFFFVESILYVCVCFSRHSTNKLVVRISRFHASKIILINRFFHCVYLENIFLFLNLRHSLDFIETHTHTISWNFGWPKHQPKQNNVTLFSRFSILDFFFIFVGFVFLFNSLQKRKTVNERKSHEKC